MSRDYFGLPAPIRSAATPRWVRWLSNLLIIEGAILIVLVGVYYGYSAYTQRQLNQFNRGLAELQQTLGTPAELQQNLGTPAETPPPAQVAVQAPRQAPPSQESPFSSTFMEIPRIQLQAKVVETGMIFKDGQWQWDTANRAVGHLEGTALPGQDGNGVYAGHISSPLSNKGNIFRRLPEVKPGDVVYVTSPAGRFQYQVIGTKVVLPTEVSAIAPTRDEIITLLTCVPDWVYTHRLIVTAKRLVD